jgi:hypothetical protein
MSWIGSKLHWFAGCRFDYRRIPPNPASGRIGDCIRRCRICGRTQIGFRSHNTPASQGQTFWPRITLHGDISADIWAELTQPQAGPKI